MSFELFFLKKNSPRESWKKIVARRGRERLERPHMSLVCGGFNEKKMRVHVSSAHFLYTDFFAAPKKNI